MHSEVSFYRSSIYRRYLSNDSKPCVTLNHNDFDEIHINWGKCSWEFRLNVVGLCVFARSALFPKFNFHLRTNKREREKKHAKRWIGWKDVAVAFSIDISFVCVRFAIREQLHLMVLVIVALVFVFVAIVLKSIHIGFIVSAQSKNANGSWSHVKQLL